VTSPCLKVLVPILMIFNRDGQFGSGHATSASVVIQSLLEVTRCFAARSGRTAPREYIEKPWSGGSRNISPSRMKWSPALAPQRMSSPGGQMTSTRRSYNWNESSTFDCMFMKMTPLRGGGRPKALKNLPIWQEKPESCWK